MFNVLSNLTQEKIFKTNQLNRYLDTWSIWFSFELSPLQSDTGETFWNKIQVNTHVVIYKTKAKYIWACVWYTKFLIIKLARTIIHNNKHRFIFILKCPKLIHQKWCYSSSVSLIFQAMTKMSKLIMKDRLYFNNISSLILNCCHGWVGKMFLITSSCFRVLIAAGLICNSLTTINDNSQRIT